MKPPFIRLFVKDFAFDIQDMSNEDLGLYMRSFLNAYKSDKIPKEKMSDSLFKELKKSFSQYSATCERNRNNRLKTKPKQNDSSTSGQPVVNDSLTNNQEPITSNQELIKKDFIDDKTKKSITLENFMKYSFPDEQIPIDWGKEAFKITNWEDDAILLEWEKFKDYWKAANNNTKKDWLATWRNWLRNNRDRKYG